MGRSIRGGLRLQNTPLGCICRVAGCRASRLLLSFFLSKRKEQSLSALRAAPSGQLRSETPLRRQKCALRKGTGEFRPLRRATRAPPWTCRPLKRAALNFRPYGGSCGAEGCAWGLGRVLNVRVLQAWASSSVKNTVTTVAGVSLEFIPQLHIRPSV